MDKIFFPDEASVGTMAIELTPDFIENIRRHIKPHPGEHSWIS
jgi:hypothetical protein